MSQVTCDSREELCMELFMVSNATETEARSEHAEVLGMLSNCVCYGRFPLSGLSVEPEYAWCSGVCVVDPVNNFIQDFDSRAIQALLCLIESNSVRTGEAVRAKIIVYLFDAILDVWNRSISKLLHQLL